MQSNESTKDDLHRGIKVAVFDIESTGLNADFGYILCIGVLDAVTGKKYMVRIDDKRNPDKTSDKWVVREGIKLLEQFDLVVSWYGAKFDHPFIDSRALKHGMQPMKKIDGPFRRDLWFTSRSRLKIRSNRLAVVGEYLFGKTVKDAITPNIWNGAIRGEKKALDYVCNHCAKDLDETLRVYKKFLPMLSKRLRKN